MPQRNVRAEEQVSLWQVRVGWSQLVAMIFHRHRSVARTKHVETRELMKPANKIELAQWHYILNELAQTSQSQKNPKLLFLLEPCQEVSVFPQHQTGNLALGTST